MSLSAKIDTIPRLLGDALDQIGVLANTEARLVRTELSEKLSQIATGVACLVGAAILAIPALVILLMALALWVSTNFEIPPAAASFIVGGLGAALGAIMGMIGLNRLSAKLLKPHATIRQVGRDIETAKDMVR